MSENINFRLEKQDLKKFDELATARRMKRSEALRDAVKEYLALWVVGREPTVGTLLRRVENIEKRLTALENFLMQKGAESKG